MPPHMRTRQLNCRSRKTPSNMGIIHDSRIGRTKDRAWSYKHTGGCGAIAMFVSPQSDSSRYLSLNVPVAPCWTGCRYPTNYDVGHPL